MVDEGEREILFRPLLFIFNKWLPTQHRHSTLERNRRMRKLITQTKQVFPAAQPQTRVVRRFRNTALFKCALLTVVLLSAIGITNGQQPDPLTVTKDGNVGIGT